ncbi:MAG: insulinase family protein [Nitrospirae bacterium]|nr:insulinase family protein [Nitrospirota bacterium]
MRHKKSCSLFTVHCSLFFILFTGYCLLFTASSAHAGIEIKREALSNGLTLMVVERHNVPVVNVALGIKAGSMAEPAEKAGLANLTAELLTEGTKKRTAGEISETMEFVGASLDTSGGDDFVTATLSVLKKDLDLGFDMLSDIIINPSFLPDELNKKRTRIKGGLKSREEDPNFVAEREFKNAVFGSYPYGRLIEGSAETLDRITQQDLIDFYSAYYAPNNAMISIVGDITMEEAKTLLKKYFSGWNKKEIKITMSAKPGPLKETKIITVDKDITQANIILGHLGISRDHPDYYSVLVMNYILGGGGFTSRLMQNVREEKGLVYDIHSFFDADKETGSFQVGLQTKNESADTAIDEVLKEIKLMRDSGASDAEIADAKSFLKGSFPMKIETGRRIANFLIAVEFYGLGMDYVSKYPAYINNVTKEDVLRVAKKYLDPEKFALVVVANQKKASVKFFK